MRRNRIVGVLFVVFCALLCLGACKRPSVSGPSPVVTVPTTLAPSPTPKPGITSPLYAVGNLFSERVKFVAICCFAYADAHGWPLIDVEALKELAKYGVNVTHIRPTTSNASWEDISEIVRQANALGIHVEVDVLDVWALAGGPGHGWPWNGDDCSITQEPPKQKHVRWISDLVRATGKYPGVLYQIGNEAFKCDPSKAWERGIYDAIRAAESEYGYARHLIGTNAETIELEDLADYGTWHGETPMRSRPDKPRLTNEYKNGTVSAEQFRSYLLSACEMGTTYGLWKGRLEGDEWTRALEYLRDHKCER